MNDHPEEKMGASPSVGLIGHAPSRPARAAGLALGLVALALSLAGCAEAEVTAPTSDCSQGERSCNATRTAELECLEVEPGLWRLQESQTCSAGSQCVDGRCSDSCHGCTTPPNACYRSPGVCANGKCLYDYDVNGKPCDDGDSCTEGDRCSTGTCRGTPIECTTPPANVCVGESAVQVFSSPGSCSAGLCSYASKDVACSLGCQAGACKGDPCTGVVCNQPPTACHRQDGICAGGSCSYLFDEGKTCDDHNACTVQDRCSGGHCAGKPLECGSPPASFCKDTLTLTTYAKPGTCKNGSCSYTKSDVTCPHGCDSQVAACRGDPCEGVSCLTPPSPCHHSPGTCIGGQCDYALEEGKTCNDGDPCTKNDSCAAGVCKGTPLTCNTAPKNVCKDASTLTSYSAPGSCSKGSCVYGSVDITCAFGCDALAGACQGDPCTTITCEAPPNQQCYSVPGLCSQGVCSYLPTAGVTCDDGEACTHTDRCDSNGKCAGVSYSCDDGLSCTTDLCSGNGGCSHPVQSTSCLIQFTCYAADAVSPQNGCEHCSPAQSQTSWTQASGTLKQSWNFDGGTLQGFTVTSSPAGGTVKWQVVSHRADTGTYSLYFGSTATWTYEDPDEDAVSGDAVSPSVTLPSSGKVCLSFRLFKATEYGTLYDQLTISALPSSTVLWSSGKQANNGNTGGAFRSFIADLSGLAGSTIQLKFSFDSVDEMDNDREGVYLDNLRVLTGCSP